MASASELAEEQAVASRERVQQAKFASKRTRSIALAAFFALTCVVLLVVGFWTLSICSLFVSLIGVSNYFASNGHLHRLQKRATHRKRLVRDFSRLDPEGPGDRGSPDPNPSGVPTPTG